MFRLTLTLIAPLASAFAFAQELSKDLGAKKDIVVQHTTQPTGASMNIWQFAPMMVALGIIFFLLKFALPKMMGKFNKSLSTPFDSPILLQESASFATGSLQVVTVRGKSLLLAITPQGVTCLSELDSKIEDNSAPAFFEILDQESEQPKEQKLVTHAVIEEEEVEPVKSTLKAHPAAKAYKYQPAKKSDSPSREELIARLEQLQKLAK